MKFWNRFSMRDDKRIPRAVNHWSELRMIHHSYQKNIIWSSFILHFIQTWKYHLKFWIAIIWSLLPNGRLWNVLIDKQFGKSITIYLSNKKSKSPISRRPFASSDLNMRILFFKNIVFVLNLNIWKLKFHYFKTHSAFANCFCMQQY